jgi:tetratricopeptide (TPR) repeat protein
VLAVDPRHADSLNFLGVIAYQVGQYQAAVDLIGQAIAIRGDIAIYHNNLGTALQGQGRLEPAVAAYRQAVALKPGLAEAHSNLGWALQQQGRLDDAIAAYLQAIDARPDLAEAHNNLGNAYKDVGRLDDAVACYEQAVALKPAYVEAHNNLATVFKDQGKLDRAMTCCNRALALKPDFAGSYNNLGAVLSDEGKVDQASACYRRALALKPDYIEAHCNLGKLLFAGGDIENAFNCFQHALKIGESAEAKSLFVQCAAGLEGTFQGDPGHLKNLMVRALSEPWGRPGDLVAVGIGLLKTDPEFADSMERALKAHPSRLREDELFGPRRDAIVDEPLLHCLLKSTPVNNLDMERFLTAARWAMLKAIEARADTAPAALRFYSALAQQCLINDYVFASTDDEERQAQTLRESLRVALQSGAPIPASWIAGVAAYFPLHTLADALQLLDRSWPEALSELLARQLREPLEERNLQASIPSLTAIADDVSLLVQQQYEENPYPRWEKAAPAPKPTTVDVSLRRTFPRAAFRSPDERNGVDILVAGCGTGQHSIETARRFRDARVLAIDLSRTSLGYAKRKTQALGLNNIDYAQADILQLGALDRRFDVIEAVGVLHHLKDPDAGWRVLLSLLRPQGFMLLGFYSERAHRHIEAAQAFIAQQGFGSGAEDIRRCRQELLAMDDDSLPRQVATSADFFTTSTCRDLLFHAQDHRLTLPKIAAFLAAHNLTFIGFNIDPRVMRKYAERFPDDPQMADLDRWHKFETENPRTFASMYQFWVQKAGAVLCLFLDLLWQSGVGVWGF